MPLLAAGAVEVVLFRDGHARPSVKQPCSACEERTSEHALCAHCPVSSLLGVHLLVWPWRRSTQNSDGKRVHRGAAVQPPLGRARDYQGR